MAKKVKDSEIQEVHSEQPWEPAPEILFYAASTGGFYSSHIHSDIPSDAVQITREQHSGLFIAQSEGKQIVAGDDGYPVAVTPKVDPVDLIKQRITEIESSITERRLRGALLGHEEDIVYLRAADSRIRELRAELQAPPK